MLLDGKGTWSATRDDIGEIEVPPITESYTPVPHLAYLRVIKGLLPHFGLQATEESFSLARDGQQLFGVLSCRSGHQNGSHSLAIGLRNSYDRSLSCGLVAGVRVLVCSNLCFGGEVIMRRRHTSRVLEDLAERIYEMLGRVRQLNDRQAEEIEELKTFELADDRAHDLMMRVVRAGAFPASKLPKVIGEWDEPQHEEFEPRTAWTLLNSFTEVQKQRGPSAQMDSGLMQVFREVCLS